MKVNSTVHLRRTVGLVGKFLFSELKISTSSPGTSEAPQKKTLRQGGLSHMNSEVILSKVSWLTVKSEAARLVSANPGRSS